MVVAESFFTDFAKPGTAYSMYRQARIIAGGSSVCGFDPRARKEHWDMAPETEFVQKRQPSKTASLRVAWRQFIRRYETARPTF